MRIIRFALLVPLIFIATIVSVPFWLWLLLIAAPMYIIKKNRDENRN